jgi:hypothetical protein
MTFLFIFLHQIFETFSHDEFYIVYFEKREFGGIEKFEQSGLEQFNANM